MFNFLLAFIIFITSFLRIFSPQPTRPSPTPTPIPPSWKTDANTTSWKLFTYNHQDSQFNFSLLYPPTWQEIGGAEGCGPVFGPPSKNPDFPYPNIAVCPYIKFPFEKTVEDYTNKPFAQLDPQIIGQISGHRFVKVQLYSPTASDENSVYTIVIETENGASSIIIYTYYTPQSYKLYGTENNFSPDNFIKTVDQIFSSFRFIDPSKP